MLNFVRLEKLLGVYTDELVAMPPVDDMADLIEVGDLVGLPFKGGEIPGIVTAVDATGAIFAVEYMLTDGQRQPFNARGQFEGGQLSLILKHAARF